MSSVGSVGSSSFLSPVASVQVGSKVGHGAKPACSGGSSPGAATNTTTTITNPDGSITTTVTGATGNTVSIATVPGALVSKGGASANYALGGTPAGASSQAAFLSIIA